MQSRPAAPTERELPRRQFLKMIVVSAAAAGVLAGCDDDDSFPVDETRFPQSVASGDPTANSVVLWTRVAAGSADQTLRLQVASDEGFSALVLDLDALPARAQADHCLRVKVTGLEAGRHYWYRFLHQQDGDWVSSRTGRTKTAPAANADVAVKYALASCQDYIGRYYNTWAWLLEQEPELDFVLHVGDYVYETTGDPRFQDTDASRKMVFADTAGAIALGKDPFTYFAASSVSNYRDLYKTYRTDKTLQRVHERYPMIAVWDDHEYSDDCWGGTSTYFNGLKNEVDPARRQRAEQVYYEFMPIDDARVGSSGALTKDASELYPNNTLYRRQRYGQHLELAVLDYRSYRADHLIPEDAFPGTVVMNAETLSAVLGAATYEAVKASFGPYVNLDQAPWNAYVPALAAILTQAYVGEGLDAATAQAKAVADLKGEVSAFIVNLLIDQYNGAVAAGLAPPPALPRIDDATYEALPRGMAYLHLGKQQFFSEFGARYGLVKSSYELYAGYMSATGRFNQDALGSKQQAFLDSALASDATFVCVASSVSTVPLVWDLSAETVLPPDFQTAFYANADHWDGFPNGKQALLAKLAARGNAFIVAGDIHASYVAAHEVGGRIVPDFTGTSITSTTFGGFVDEALPTVTATFTPEQAARARVVLVDELDQNFQKAYPAMKFAESRKNGVVVIKVDGSGTEATYHLIDEKEVGTDYTGSSAELAKRFSARRFRFTRSGAFEVL